MDWSAKEVRDLILFSGAIGIIIGSVGTNVYIRYQALKQSVKKKINSQK